MVVGVRARLALAMMFVAMCTLVLAVCSPLRANSGDTVPARLGGAVLSCAGTFDLRRIDWIQREADQNSTYYYMHPDRTGAYTSIFGPVPAVVAALALVDYGDGDRITDVELRTRERDAAAVLLAFAAALLVLAAGARCGPIRAGVTGLVAVASFAGAATLGQGLWQATTAMPFLIGALATLAWRDRRPRLATVGAPALLVVAVLLRPTIAPLAFGLGLVWLVHARPRSPRMWIVTAAVVLAAAAPLVVWNAVHLFSPFPIAQWKANKQMTESVFSLGHVASGIAGLVASPGRGLVWFAPIFVAGVARGLRKLPSAPDRPWRFVAVGIVLQLVAMALFFKWHGGQAYGPRLLAEATWIAIFLALGTGIDDRARHVVSAAAVVTCVVGLLGLWCWQPEQWERRRVPEAHPSAFWDFVDSPIAAMFVDHGPTAEAFDAPTSGLECRPDGTLHSIAPAKRP